MSKREDFIKEVTEKHQQFRSEFEHWYTIPEKDRKILSEKWRDFLSKYYNGIVRCIICMGQGTMRKVYNHIYICEKCFRENTKI